MTQTGTGVPTNLSILRRLLQIARPFRWRILGAIGLGFMTILSGIGLLGTSAYLISAAALQPSIAELQVAIVGVRFFGLSRGVFRYLERLVGHDATLHLLGGLRVWFYQRLEPLAPARMLEYRSGDLLSRVVHDIDILEDLYIRVVSPALIAMGIGIGTGILLGCWDPLFAIVYWLFYFFAAFCIPWGAAGFSRKAARARITLRGELEGTLLENIGGLGDLLIFDPSNTWLDRLHALSYRYEHTLVKLSRITGASEALLNLTQNLTLAAMILIAIPAVLRGALDGVFVAVILLIATASFEAALPLTNSSRQWFASQQAARRLFEVLDARPQVTEPRRPIPIGESSTLGARELEFYYPEQADPALREVTFDINRGGKIGVVGRSGSGKSTLVQLLLRFWEYQKGSLYLNDVDFREASPHDLRQRMAVVEQDGYIFEGTIRQNLRLANSQATDLEIQEALRISEAKAFIDGFPAGLDTWVGEHGYGLSGGEARRLIIARTLLQDRKILLLDEPTADLDALTAARLIQALQTRLEDTLSIWITHRLDGLEFLDEILVLEKGSPIERGEFSDLIRRKGTFFKQWSRQLDTALVDDLLPKFSGR